MEKTLYKCIVIIVISSGSGNSVSYSRIIITSLSNALFLKFISQSNLFSVKLLYKSPTFPLHFVSRWHTPRCRFSQSCKQFSWYCGNQFSRIASQACSGDNSVFGFMLGRNIFKTLQTALPLECSQACEGDVRCQSFNYVISKDTRELYNRSKKARPEDLLPSSERYYCGKSKNRGNFKHFSVTQVPYCWFLFTAFAQSNSALQFNDIRTALMTTLVLCSMKQVTPHFSCVMLFLFVLHCFPSIPISCINCNRPSCDEIQLNTCIYSKKESTLGSE